MNMSQADFRWFAGRSLLAAIAMTASASAWGQPGASRDGGFTRTVFARGLDRPETVAPLSDHVALVAERSGRILLFDGGKRVDLGSIDIAGLNNFFVVDRPYTEGLKDLISVPGKPGEFLWCMTTGNSSQVRWTVGAARVTTGRGASQTMANEIVWQSDPQGWTRSSPPPFSGCRLAIDDDDDVVVAMGANDRATGSGRVVRVSLSGRRPPRLMSTGHRNPSGLLFHSGILWEVEHGPKGGDELNVVVPGGDYGWSGVSSGKPDDDAHRSFLERRPGAIDPVLVWTPAIAPSGITEWRGKFYIGALKGAVMELNFKRESVISQRRLLEFEERIRDVRSVPGGSVLWVLTDGTDGKLFHVFPKRKMPGAS